MIKKLIQEHKKRKEREKLKKGLDAFHDILKQMEASGAYSEEVLNNATLWFGAACLEYAKMFN